MLQAPQQVSFITCSRRGWDARAGPVLTTVDKAVARMDAGGILDECPVPSILAGLSRH